MMIKEETSTDVLFANAMERAEKEGYLKEGELAVITAGVPLGMSGTTNLIRVAVAGQCESL